MVLKFISRFIGKFLLSTSLTIFILTFFIISLIGNVDVLKKSIKDELTPELIIDQIITSESEKLSAKEVIELCKKNPQQKGCEEITDPSLFFDEQLKPLVSKLEEIKPQVILARTASIVIFLLSILFIYLGTFNIIVTGYIISFSIFLTSLFYAVFYKFLIPSLPNLIQNFLLQSKEEIPKKLIEVFIKIFSNWLQTPVNIVFNICLILTLIFLPLTILFYFLKRKQSKKQSSKGQK